MYLLPTLSVKTVPHVAPLLPNPFSTRCCICEAIKHWKLFEADGTGWDPITYREDWEYPINFVADAGVCVYRLEYHGLHLNTPAAFEPGL